MEYDLKISLTPVGFYSLVQTHLYFNIEKSQYRKEPEIAHNLGKHKVDKQNRVCVIVTRRQPSGRNHGQTDRSVHDLVCYRLPYLLTTNDERPQINVYKLHYSFTNYYNFVQTARAEGVSLEEMVEQTTT